MLSKGSWFTPFLTPVFMFSLSTFHSLPKLKILLEEILGLRRRRSFEFILLRLELYWQPATIGGDFWCSKMTVVSEVSRSTIKIWFRPVPAAHTESQGISPSVVYFLL